MRRSFPIITGALQIGCALLILLTGVSGCSDSGSGRGVRRSTQTAEDASTGTALPYAGSMDIDGISVRAFEATDEAVAAASAIRQRGSLRVATRRRSGVYEPDPVEASSDEPTGEPAHEPTHEPAREPSGLQYLLARGLARELGVVLEVVVVDRIADYFSQSQGADRLPVGADIYVDLLTILPVRERLVGFVETIPVRPIIVSARAGIDSPSDLDGRRVSVASGSSYETWLRELGSHAGIVPTFVEVETTADMVTAVVDGRAEATVQDSILGIEIVQSFPDLYLGAAVGLLQRLGWAVPTNDGGLAALVRQYLRHSRETGLWERLWIDEYGIGYLEYLALIGL